MMEKPITTILEEWVEMRRPSWRRGTFNNAADRIGRFVRFAGEVPVTNERLKAYFLELAQVFHPCTYNCHRITLRSAFRAIGYPDLMDGISACRSVSTPLMYFQKQQIERIRGLLVREDPELWLFCQFIYYCFIRPGELRLLKVSDILFDENKVLLRADISKNKKQQFVTIPEPFRAEVAALRGRAGDELVFGRKNDRLLPRGESTMRQKFRGYLKELGFGPGYQLYSFKHTGAVAVVQAGVNLKELQIQLRHHSLEMVDVYIRQLGVWDLKNLENKFPPI